MDKAGVPKENPHMDKKNTFKSCLCRKNVILVKLKSLLFLPISTYTVLLLGHLLLPAPDHEVSWATIDTSEPFIKAGSIKYSDSNLYLFAVMSFAYRLTFKGCSLWIFRHSLIPPPYSSIQWRLHPCVVWFPCEV